MKKTGKPAFSESICQRRLYRGCSKTVRNSVPIDHIPEGSHVIRTLVLIVQIIGMLPHVQAEEGSPLEIRYVHQRIVLIGRRANGQLLVSTDDQPRPARTEPCFGRLVKLAD